MNENKSTHSKVQFVGSFFGRNVYLKKSFWLFLTFKICTKKISVWLESKNWNIDLKWNPKLNHQSAQALYHLGNIMVKCSTRKSNPSKTRIVNKCSLCKEGSLWMLFNQPVCNLWTDQSGLCIRLLMIGFWGGLNIDQFDEKMGR